MRNGAVFGTLIGLCLVSIRIQAADMLQSVWPPADMKDLPADYLDRLHSALQRQSDRFNDPRTKTKNPVIMVRVGVAALALNQHVDELNAYFEADGFGCKASEDWGFSLFSASYCPNLGSKSPRL